MKKQIPIIHFMLRTFLVFLAFAQGLVDSGQGATFIHTYNAGRDKAAQAVKEAYSKVDVVQVVRMEETNLAAIAELELSLLESQAILRRDAELFRITTSTNSLSEVVFTNTLQKYWRWLVGTNDLTAQEKNALDNLGSARLAAGFADLKDQALRVKLAYGVNPPPFGYTTNTLPPVEEWFAQHAVAPTSNPVFYNSYTRSYLRVAGMVQPVFRTQGGKLVEALTRVTKERERLEARRKAAKAAAAEYQTAVKGYNDAVAAAQRNASGDIQKALGQLDTHLEKINKALANLAKAGDVFGKFAAVTNQLAALDLIVGAAVSTNTTAVGDKVKDPALRKAIVVASHLHGLLDKSGELERVIRKPPLIDSLIKREILLIEKETLQRAMARQEARIKLVENIWLSRLSAFDLMKNIHALQQRIPPGGFALTPNRALGSENAEPWRTDLTEILLHYSDIIRVSEYNERVAEFSLTHLIYQEANDASNSAARMWNSLIANPINQLAAYHSSGIKTEQVADLVVKALGAGAIAWRLK